MKVLLVEDTQSLADAVRRGLQEEGFAVEVARDGEEGLHLAGELPFDVIVLDRMLPGVDGLAVLGQLRARGDRTPVLLLTALGQVDDRVEGLNAGADDYLVKPFAFQELLARVHALARRQAGPASNVLALPGLAVDVAARTATAGGRALGLTAKEYALLELFARHPGRTFSRQDIIQRLYDEAAQLESNVVDVLVGRLRRKLSEADAQSPCQVATVRGAGYRLDVAAPEVAP